ncbi:MAG: outer membrane protein assembly factor BamE [Alphaproteobacteria bacterium]|nr:outer membrane protein assembly factor BamE [Alphaproteobacteria bacterium]
MKKILLFLLLSSCVTRLEKHGYMFDLSDYQLIQDGVTSKERLLKIMGSPTLITENDIWIYYAEDVEHFLFFKPKIVDRKILTMRFDRHDIVQSLHTVSLEHEDKQLSFATNQTAVRNHDSGLFKSFFSNVGQVKPH